LDDWEDHMIMFLIRNGLIKIFLKIYDDKSVTFQIQNYGCNANKFIGSTLLLFNKHLPWILLEKTGRSAHHNVVQIITSWVLRSSLRSLKFRIMKCKLVEVFHIEI
jgi:hypothetical protein